MAHKHEAKARRIASLLTGFLKETLTQAEYDELDLWVGASDTNMRLFEEITDERRVELALQFLNTGILPAKIDSLTWEKKKRSLKLRIGSFFAIVLWIIGLGIATWICFVINNIDSFFYGLFFGMTLMHMVNKSRRNIRKKQAEFGTVEFDH